jgi:membrane protease YdiL (CAAX protease family)
MQNVIYLFWAGVLAALALAFWDCLRWPRQTAVAWRHFRPVALTVVVVAAGFLGINLVRFGWSVAGELLQQTFRLVGTAVGAAIFFCGGWVWLARAGHTGLFDQIRRKAAGLPAPELRRAVAETLAVAAGVVLFSILLFLAVKAESSATFRDWLELQESTQLRSGFLPLLLLLAPLWEETAFRWYLLGRIEEAIGRAWVGRVLAILATSALWALGHAALIDPPWVKLVQIFAIGCLLAWRFRVIGLSGCIVAHLVMNLPAVFFPT